MKTMSSFASTRSRVCVPLAFLCLGAAPDSHGARNGTLDVSEFGVNGTAHGLTEKASVERLRVLPDGRILTVGNYWSKAARHLVLETFEANARAATAAGRAGKVSDACQALPWTCENQIEPRELLAPEGSRESFIAGTISIEEGNETASPGHHVFIARAKADGALDPTYAGGKGIALSEPAMKDDINYATFRAWLGSGNRVLVGASYYRGKGPCPTESCFIIHAFNRATGAVDDTFGRHGTAIVKGLAPEFTIGAAAESRDGLLLLAGSSVVRMNRPDTRKAQARPLICAVDRNLRTRPRCLPEGLFDAQLGGANSTFISSLKVLSGDGGVLVGGDVDSRKDDGSNSVLQSYLARLKADLSLDRSFGTQGVVKLPTAVSEYHRDILKAVVETKDGSFIVLQTRRYGEDSTHDFPTFSRYLRNGRRDDSFGDHGAFVPRLANAGLVQTFALDARDRIVVAGFSPTPEPFDERTSLLARYLDGSRSKR